MVRFFSIIYGGREQACLEFELSHSRSVRPSKMVAESEIGHVPVCRRLGLGGHTGSGQRRSCETWPALAAWSISAAQGTGSSFFSRSGRASRKWSGQGVWARGLIQGVGSSDWSTSLDPV